MAQSGKLTAADKLRIQRRFLDGERIIDIAIDYGVNRETVAYHVDKVRRQQSAATVVAQPAVSIADRIRARFAPGCQPRYGR